MCVLCIEIAKEKMSSQEIYLASKELLLTNKDIEFEIHIGLAILEFCKREISRKEDENSK